MALRLPAGSGFLPRMQLQTNTAFPTLGKGISFTGDRADPILIDLLNRNDRPGGVPIRTLTSTSSKNTAKESKTAGDILKEVGKRGLDILEDAIRNKLGGGGGGGGTTLVDDPCPIPGQVKVLGKCVKLRSALPGGDPLITGGAGEIAVVGAFGLPALTPTIVGQRVNARGELVALRQCPRAMVLGVDNLCYPRQLLGARGQFRKHKAAKRPPMTAADATALRRIGTLQKKVKGLAKDAGLQCGTRARARGPRKK